LAYLSLYRKWRPQSFKDVVGQEHVVRTLKNALDSGRTAHAYIFSGPRGTGKTTLARLLAKGLNCEQGPTGDWCNACDNCLRIARGQAVDVIEIDGASNRGIDEIRDVREKVKFAPAQGPYKIYIIDEVHMLTVEAFNALLKVLEEPPRHVIFVFATTEPHRIPATIVSRCQKFDFRAFTPREIAEQVQNIAENEGVKVDGGALRLIATHSAGGMRDALGFLDQCIAFADGAITESLAAQVLGVVERERLEALAEAISGKDLAEALRLVKSVSDTGRDLRQFASDAVQFFRDLLLLRAAPDGEGLVVLADADRERSLELASRFEVSELLHIVEKLGKAEGDMRWATTAQLPLEMALIEVIRSERSPSLEEIVERLERLEGLNRIDRSAAPAPTSPTPRALERTGAPQTHPAPQTHRDSPSQFQRASGSPKKPEEQAQKPQTAQREPAPLPSGAETKVAADVPDQSHGSAAATSSPLLDRVLASWQSVLDTLRAQRSIQQEAFLREGKPGAVEGSNTVVIYFSPSHRFHQANIENEKNRVIVEKAMTKLLGQEIRVKAVLGEPPERGAMQAGPVGGHVAAPEPERGSVPSAGNDRDDVAATADEVTHQPIDPDEIDEPILKAALKLFGGTITKLERKEAQK